MDSLMDRVVRRHPEAGLQRFGGRLMAVTPDDKLHSFEDEAGASEVGERIVDLADGKRTVREIVRVLCDEFEVDEGTCERDTASFVRLLVERKVLVLD